MSLLVKLSNSKLYRAATQATTGDPERRLEIVPLAGPRPPGQRAIGESRSGERAEQNGTTGSFRAGGLAAVRALFALNSEDPRAIGFVWGFGHSLPRNPRSASFGEVFVRTLEPFHRPRFSGRCDSVRSGNSRRDISPAQIAIGFVLENFVIAPGGRRASSKADKMSSACVLSKSIAKDTASVCSQVAPCLVHNASRPDADGLSPCHRARPLLR